MANYPRKYGGATIRRFSIGVYLSHKFIEKVWIPRKVQLTLTNHGFPCSFPMSRQMNPEKVFDSWFIEIVYHYLWHAQIGRRERLTVVQPSTGKYYTIPWIKACQFPNPAFPSPNALCRTGCVYSGHLI
jgi:hypothetical protein